VAQSKLSARGREPTRNPIAPSGMLTVKVNENTMQEKMGEKANYRMSRGLSFLTGEQRILISQAVVKDLACTCDITKHCEHWSGTPKDSITLLAIA